MLSGAILMQNWDIRVCPDSESLDLFKYADDFVAFAGG